jgi:hypothetical protein
MEYPVLWGSEFGCCHVHVIRNWLPGLLTRCSAITYTSASHPLEGRGTLGISVFLKVLLNNTFNFFRLYSVGVIHEEAGGPVEWFWQGKSEVLGEEPVPVPPCPPQIPHGLVWDWNRASQKPWHGPFCFSWHTESTINLTQNYKALCISFVRKTFIIEKHKTVLRKSRSWSFKTNITLNIFR